MKRLICNTDGGSRGNPGKAAIGIYIRNKDKTFVIEYGECIGTTTNNVAEYTALEKCLYILKENNIKEADIYLDSLLVVNQVNGFWKIKDDNLRVINERIQELLKSFDDITLEHVVRKYNKEADALVNRALDVSKIIYRKCVKDSYDNGLVETEFMKEVVSSTKTTDDVIK